MASGCRLKWVDRGRWIRESESKEMQLAMRLTMLTVSEMAGCGKEQPGEHKQHGMAGTGWRRSPVSSH